MHVFFVNTVTRYKSKIEGRVLFFKKGQFTAKKGPSNKTNQGQKKTYKKMGRFLALFKKEPPFAPRRDLVMFTIKFMKNISSSNTL